MSGRCTEALVDALRGAPSVASSEIIRDLVRAYPDKYAGAYELWSSTTDPSSPQKKRRRVHYMCTNCYVSTASDNIDIADSTDPRTRQACPTCGPQDHVILLVAATKAGYRIRPVNKISLENDRITHHRAKAPHLAEREGTVTARSAQCAGPPVLSRCMASCYWLSYMHSQPGPSSPNAWTAQKLEIQGSSFENVLEISNSGHNHYVPLYLPFRAAETYSYLTADPRAQCNYDGMRYLDKGHTFRIGALLGKGSNGSVFRATRITGGIEEPCALKSQLLTGTCITNLQDGAWRIQVSMEKAYLCSEGIIGRVIAEMEGTSSKENILCPSLMFAVVFPELKKVFLFLTMPLMYSSITPLLRQLGTREARMPFCRRVLRRILSGLASTHPSGFCHADIKPDNILVGQAMRNAEDSKECADTAVLGDLGLSRLDRRAPPGTPCMSNEYRPPEAWLGLSWGSPADMWAVGCVGMEIILGGTFFMDYKWPGGPQIKDTRRDYLATICLFFGPIPAHMLQGLARDAREDAEYASLAPRAGSHDIAQYFHNDPSMGPIMDLLRRLLVLSPEVRLTASEALAHPFFREA